MTFFVEITQQAETDLQEIYDYIAFQLLSPENATGQLNRLERNIMMLDEMPERFHLYEKEPWRSRGLRMMTVDRYVVLYLPNRQTATVTILRVMYGGRDIDAQLKNENR